MDSKDSSRQPGQISNDFVYSTVKTITEFMDKKFLDPILGFLFPAFGDILMSVLVIPYLYLSAFKIKSVALTLAIILNTLIDVIVGLIPYGVGDILDIFHRSYSKNMRLIDGFILRDEKVVREVKRKAWLSAVLIIVSCIAFYFLFKLAFTLIMGGFSLISSLFY